MAATSTFRASFRQARAEATRRPPRTPIAVRLGRTLGRLLPHLAALRTFVLSLVGLGLLSYAAWMLAAPAGLAVAGISVLVLEYLVSSDGGRGGAG